MMNDIYNINNGDSQSLFSETISECTYRKHISDLKVDNIINNIKNTNFDINKLEINFEQIKTDKHGRKQIPIKYDGGIFKITTPLLRIPFGIDSSEINNNKQYKVALSFDNINEDKNIKEFYNFIKGIENYVKDKIYENQEILQKNNNKKKPKEVIDEFFSSKIYENEKYDPLLTLNLRINSEYSNTNIYYDNIDTELFINDGNFEKTKGCFVKCEIICHNLWISGGKYGISWKVDKLIIYNKKVKITNVNFD